MDQPPALALHVSGAHYASPRGFLSITIGQDASVCPLQGGLAQAVPHRRDGFHGSCIASAAKLGVVPLRKARGTHRLWARTSA